MFCFAKGTEVMKSDSTVCKIEDLKECDLVMGDDYKPREIMDICEGRTILYNVKLSNGVEFKVTENHILVLGIKNNETDKYELVEISVLDYITKIRQFDENKNKHTENKSRDYKTCQIFNDNHMTYYDFNITMFGDGDYFGIHVDGNQRFLLKDGYIAHNSGKTSELIRLYSRAMKAKKNCIVIKYAEDTRYSNEHLATHDGRKIEAVSTSLLFELENQCADKDIIFIDEIQFYEDNLEFCEKMASMGKKVIASGLNGDFQRKPFSDKMAQLISHAEDTQHLKAICVRCGSESGSFTKRIIAGDEKKVIGGEEAYIAVCRKCYFANENMTK